MALPDKTLKYLTNHSVLIYLTTVDVGQSCSQQDPPYSEKWSMPSLKNLPCIIWNNSYINAWSGVILKISKGDDVYWGITQTRNFEGSNISVRQKRRGDETDCRGAARQSLLLVGLRKAKNKETHTENFCYLKITLKESMTQQTAKYTLFSSSHGTFARRDHLLHHKR